MPARKRSRSASARHLTDRDYITSTHRGHGHCIAKGVDIAGMVAELMGKATGICKGKGGSMHIADVDKGMLGANGIVGGGIPLAAGAALTAKTLGTGGVAVCFFGDGASNQGTFHESLNLAAIWNLPVVFVCENNGYAESTPVHYHCSTVDIANRAAGYEMPGVVVDGLDLFAVYEAAGEAIARARRGEGPDADRGQDLPLLRPLPGRHGHVSHRRGAEPLQGAGRDPVGPQLRCRSTAWRPPRSSTRSTPARREHARRAWNDAKAAPWPEPRASS